MKRSLLAIVLFLVLVMPVESIAQPPEDFDRPPTKQQMKRTRERIETLRMWKLTKAIDLDEKSSAELFPILNRYDRQRREIENALWSGMKDLRESLRGSRTERLKDIIERLEHNHMALQRVNDEERAELKRILTVEQQAKFILFQHEFNKEIRRTIAEAREKRLERHDRGKP